MRRIIISDIHSNNNGGVCTGHYIALARMYKALFKNIADVKIASGPIYKKYFDSDSLIELPFDMVVGKNYAVNRVKALANARSLFRQTRKDIVVLQDGKPLTNHIGSLLFCSRHQTLYMIKYTTAGLSSPIGRIIWKLLKSRVSGIICPNENVGKAFGIPYCVVPDYIYSGVGGHCPVPYESKLYDFCIVGRLNRDKGVDGILKVLSNMDYKVLVAGMPESEEYGKLLSSICCSNSAIDLRLGYVDEADYQNYINSSRFCLLNYQGEYSKRSSGVVYDIIFSGVPVVGNRCQALQFVEDSGLGYIYDSIQDLSTAELFDKGIYERYLGNIDTYRTENGRALDKLKDFLR